MRFHPVLACAALLAAAAVVPAVAGAPETQAAAAEGSQGSNEAKGEAKVRTLEGKVVCAKCALHEEGRTACQNVLVVEHDGKTRQFYLTQNDVNKEFGEVCTGSPLVRITGEITKQDGKTWITASEIKPLADKG